MKKKGSFKGLEIFCNVENVFDNTAVIVLYEFSDD